MSVTVSGTSEWVSVTEAAHLTKVSERTVQRWIENQRVVSDMSDDGRRRVRRESLPLSDRWSGDSSVMTDTAPAADRQVTDTSDTMSDGLTDTMSDVVDCPTTNDSKHALSDITAGLERERDQALREVDHLRAQLEVRTEELRRRDQAEEQLRVMLVRLEQTNAQLSSALVQKALPPHVDTEPETPKKVRWWALWRR